MTTGPEPPAERIILHVDMDAFYVSVEVLQDPTLRGKALIVGGEGPRGVVASCSYEARAFGVRSAMPSVRAKRLCPQAIFLRGNHGLYSDYSSRIHDVFRSFTPHIEPIALDEAFLDLSYARRLFGSGPEAAQRLRSSVYEATGLWCSVGVASNKLLAKLASKEAKPPIGGAPERTPEGTRRTSEGVLEVLPQGELAFLHRLPVRALWGVGPKTFERLQRFGISTIGDLAALPSATLIRALGDANGRHLHALSNGIDNRPVVSDQALKSVGHEETFAVDHFTPDSLDVELLRMSDAVASRMRTANVRGRTVQLKLKLTDFRSLTRSKTLPAPIETARPMYETAIALLRAPDVAEEIARFGVRLVGVSMSNLVERVADVPTSTGDVGADHRTFPEPALQLDLFGSEPPRNDDRASNGAAGPGAPATNAGDPTPIPADRETRADAVIAETVDAIRARFGSASVGSAALAGRAKLRVKTAGDTQWGPAAPPSDEAT